MSAISETAAVNGSMSQTQLEKETKKEQNIKTLLLKCLSLLNILRRNFINLDKAGDSSMFWKTETRKGKRGENRYVYTLVFKVEQDVFQSNVTDTAAIIAML